MYVEKKIAHDFHDIFDPKYGRDSLFVAAVISDEIKAIAQCNRHDDTGVLLRRVAHAPRCEVVVDALIQLLINQHISIEDSLSKTQPRWALAYNFYRSEDECTDEEDNRDVVDFE